MPNMLWQGDWITRTRIVTGLILFTYALFHFLNIGMGLFSPDWMEAFQDGRQVVTRSVAGTIVLYAALLLHAGLALWKLGRRRTLRMSPGEALQLVLGLIIPLQLITHFTFTRYAHETVGQRDEMSYVILSMWGDTPVWWQSGLLLVVWLHGCIGLHFWLRLTRWWSRALPWLTGVAVLVPAFALAGLLTEGRRMAGFWADSDLRADIVEFYNVPPAETIAALYDDRDLMRATFLALLGLALAVYVLRKLLARRRSVRIRYVGGPEIVSEKGMTLLEMSRANGVPHTALCGGKGRCTTCRVIVESGAEHLPPPAEVEARSLAAIKAAPGTRLACQIRPTAPLSVYRVFRPEGGRNRAHASQGSENQLAILFLDMRGFTARTTGQLPYDVVFLLNRFFDAIVPAITRQGGTVDKYLGDGLLALFETRDAASSARAGLRAAGAVGRALDRFNQTLTSEGDPPIRIGIGLHLGNVVLGEIGAAGNAPRTIIGDTVNTASRLEAQTKAEGVELLVSDAVLAAAGHPPEHLPLREFTLRGVSRPVTALPVEKARELDALLGLTENPHAQTG